eukprot:GHVN01080536.1.p1 GENE.GHVN01080536.1~~GHVN01080536.1.p1  ORF type:complete len:167 (+),score=23.78 GHVN01080536.1:266-766(+)
MGLADGWTLGEATGPLEIRQNHLRDDMKAAVNYLKQRGFSFFEVESVRFNLFKSRGEQVCKSFRLIVQLLSEWAIKLEASNEPLSSAEVQDPPGAALKNQRPNEHLCPITTEVMTDPVMITCGDTFERSAIVDWFKNNNTCPNCRQPSDKKLMPNKVVKKIVQDFK